MSLIPHIRNYKFGHEDQIKFQQAFPLVGLYILIYYTKFYILNFKILNILKYLLKNISIR